MRGTNQRVAVLSLTFVAALVLPVTAASADGTAPGRAIFPSVRSQTTLAQAPPALLSAVEHSLAPSLARQELTAPTARRFGNSLALSGTTALIGALYTNHGAGAVYVLAETGGVWSQEAELTASDAAPDAVFGSSVALSGTTALIGAENADGGRGEAYIFTGAVHGNNWVMVR
jgi:FG-GAP repeat